MILKIRAPKQTAHKDILTILEKHGDWIVQQIDKRRTKQTYSPPLQYIQGEEHPFIGHSYPLEIEENIHKKQNIQIINQKLHITLHHNTPLKVFALLDSWYRFQALELFSKRMMHMHPVIPWINWENCPPLLRIKKMTSRWGSYMHRDTGIVTLNQHLIKAPLHCIDYVILHELCHAKEPNHSKQFYALITPIMPHWKSYQSQLQQQYGALLHTPTPTGTALPSETD